MLAAKLFHILSLPQPYILSLQKIWRLQTNEFFENGNLDEWLHPTPITNESFENPRKLSLIQRLNIAIDIATALDYLHHHCQTPIVHCDLKPSNVLLDDKMIGHVSDFGLAKFLHAIIQDSSANQSSSIVVRGTIGYTPPGKYHCHFLYLIVFLFPLSLVLFYSLKAQV